jgi:hypothetical protein
MSPNVDLAEPVREYRAWERRFKNGHDDTF